MIEAVEIGLLIAQVCMVTDFFIKNRPALFDPLPENKQTLFPEHNGTYWVKTADDDEWSIAVCDGQGTTGLLPRTWLFPALREWESPLVVEIGAEVCASQQ